MLRLRPYKPADAATVLSWCTDEATFYRWTAGMLGSYPATPDTFAFVETIMPFIVFDEGGPQGFFTLRHPNESLDELRMGFIILNPQMRGKGYGKKMVQLGLAFAFELYGAHRVSLGVFENNLAAYRCYTAAGFKEVTKEPPETYEVLGEAWVCRELVAKRPA